MCFILHWFFYRKSNVIKEFKKGIRVRPDVLIRKRVMTRQKRL